MCNQLVQVSLFTLNVKFLHTLQQIFFIFDIKSSPLFLSNGSETSLWLKLQHQPYWLWKSRPALKRGENKFLMPPWKIANSDCDDQINLRRKNMISTPLMMENPVRSPMVPPMRLNWASVLIFLSLSTLSKVAVSKWICTSWSVDWGRSIPDINSKYYMQYHFPEVTNVAHCF